MSTSHSPKVPIYSFPWRLAGENEVQGQLGPGVASQARQRGRMAPSFTNKAHWQSTDVPMFVP